MLHLSALPQLPRNIPILGETLQGRLGDSVSVYMEQTTHHPPASNLHLVHDGGKWEMTGVSVWKAAFLGNSIRGSQTGGYIIRFHDGCVIHFNLPMALKRGIIFGERASKFEGTVHIEDITHGLVSKLVYDPDEQGAFLSFFSKAASTCDTVRGGIFKSPNAGVADSNEAMRIAQEYIAESIAKGRVERTDAVATSKVEYLCTSEGSWLHHLDIGGERVWDWDDSVPFQLHAPPGQVLPSDARLREDAQMLATGDLVRAQEVKTMLEQKQRYERKLRKVDV